MHAAPTTHMSFSFFTFSLTYFSTHGMVPSIKMHAFGRCLRDVTGKGLFFVQIFSLLLSSAVPNVPQIICAERFLKDATEDVLRHNYVFHTPTISWNVSNCVKKIHLNLHKVKISFVRGKVYTNQLLKDILCLGRSTQSSYTYKWKQWTSL
jgi:hypothetical protein